MPLFKYEAVNQDGIEIRGTVESTDRDQALSDIESGGLYVINIKPTVAFLNSLNKKFAHRNIKRKDVIEFATNLSIMIRAGVPLISAIRDIAESSEEKPFRDMLLDIKTSIEQGTSLSEALKKHSAVFPDILIRLAAIGEETGSLERSLQDVAEHLQRIEDLLSTVKRAMIYPVFALISTGGALVFWMVFVLPQLLGLFAEMELDLPWTTQLLIVVSDFFKEFWYLIVFGPVVLFILILIIKKNEKGAYYVDLCKIKMPIFKHLIYNKLLALFTEQFRILIVAGITIDRSLKIIAEIIGNNVFKTAIDQTIENIISGNRISDSLKSHPVFPPMLVRMVDVGESSGSLDNQLGFLSEYYLKHLDAVADKIGKMIEPILITVIGLIFVFIIVSLLFPVYDLITQID